jgi:hypothetical protein
MTCDDARIKTIEPLLTMVGGDIAFRSEGSRKELR